MEAADPAARVQDRPLKCHVPVSCVPLAAVPNTQTSVGETAIRPVIIPPRQRMARRQRVPFQCRTYLPYWLAAQISVAEGALASLMKPVSPAGRADGVIVRPFQRSATGMLGPPGLVPPKTHASRPPVATTTE